VTPFDLVGGMKTSTKLHGITSQMAVTMNIIAFCDVPSHSLVEMYQYSYQTTRYHIPEGSNNEYYHILGCDTRWGGRQVLQFLQTTQCHIPEDKLLPRAKQVLFLDVPSPMKPGAQWQEKLPAFFSTHICEQAPK